MAHKWTKAQRAKLSATLRERAMTKSIDKEFAAQKKKNVTHVSVIPQNHLADAESTLGQAPKTPSVDINYIRAQSFRQGLVTALECILRELR